MAEQPEAPAGGASSDASRETSDGPSTSSQPSRGSVTITAEERLERVRAQLSGGRAGSRSGRRMDLSRGSNILVGAALNAAARLGDGLELTDLEQSLVGAMRTVVADEEITAWGQVFEEQAAARGRSELFPAEVLDGTAEHGFSMQDLIAALPVHQDEITSQPNVAIVNLAEVDPDAPLQSDEFCAAAAEYGGAVIVLSIPAAGTRSSATPMQGSLRLMRFKCLLRGRDSLGSPSNEIYWSTSAGSDEGHKTTYKSTEFGDIDTGSERNFPANTFLFSGGVREHLSAHIQCWEADDSGSGFYNDLQQAMFNIADRCVEASGQLQGEDAAGWAALLAVVAALVGWLMGLVRNEDDLVDELTIGYDSQSLAWLHDRPNRETSLQFGHQGNQNGIHRLHVQWDGPRATDPVAVCSSDDYLQYRRGEGSMNSMWVRVARTQLAMSGARMVSIDVNKRAVFMANWQLGHGHEQYLGDYAEQVAVTGDRIGVLKTLGDLWMAFDGNTSLGSRSYQDGVRDFALARLRIGLVMKENGRVAVKEGAPHASYANIAEGASRIALSGDRIVILKSNGEAWAREGPLGASGWVKIGGDITQVAADGLRLGLVQSNGVAVVHEGTLDQLVWTAIAGNVRQLVLSDNRIGIVDTSGVGALYVGPLHDYRRREIAHPDVRMTWLALAS